MDQSPAMILARLGDIPPVKPATLFPTYPLARELIAANAREK